MRAKNDTSDGALLRSRRFASLLLFAMGGLLVLSVVVPRWLGIGDNAFIDVLRSGARAGVVGGIADWFAITALFRHPLNLPIPHTAILPRQQTRLAHALGHFIATQFFSEADVMRVVKRARIARFASEFLRKQDVLIPIASSVRCALPTFFAKVEDGTAVTAISRTLPSILQSDEMVSIAARALRAAIDDALHQDVLSYLIDRAKTAMQQRESVLHQFVEKRVNEQGGRVIGWMIGPSVANRVITALYLELERVDPENSDLRERVTQWLRKGIDRFEFDAEWRRKISEDIVEFIRHDTLKSWSKLLWQRFRTMLEESSRDNEGWSQKALEALLLDIADQLATNPKARKHINGAACATVEKLLLALQEGIAHYIGHVMSHWDPQKLAEKLEHRIGKDLQYIRINGTLVGFLVGAVLDLVMRFFVGQSA